MILLPLILVLDLLLNFGVFLGRAISGPGRESFAMSVKRLRKVVPNQQVDAEASCCRVARWQRRSHKRWLKISTT